MSYFDSILDTFGNTPLVKLQRSAPEGVTLLAKVEYQGNPTASVKDRIAINIIKDGEKKGIINKDTTIIEATSGNTGIGLAFACAVRGYKLILTMPESMSIERRKLLKAYGAQIVLTPREKGMPGAIAKSEELHEQNPNSIIAKQFENEANVQIHQQTTAVEIWDDSKGEVDYIVSPVGTGGTLTGISSVLKEKKPSIKIIAVEPKDSPVISGGKPGPHMIQGIGAGFIPKNLDTALIDDIIQVENEEAFKFSRQLGTTEGILGGISSGASFKAALDIANRPEAQGKTIVFIVPSFAERYMSTKLFEGITE